MPITKEKTFKIEAMYAGLQSSYWFGVCMFSGFMAIYLGYYGFSDTLIGLTSSLISFITVAFQLFVSSYSDKHPQVPIKRTAAFIYIGVLALTVLLSLVPMPLALMLLAYSLSGGLINAMPGLYNALIMQFVNLGIPVNLGWPRGVSAMVYAATAFLTGLALERFAASILMPLCVAAMAITLFFAWRMPVPKEPAPATAPAPAHPSRQTGFRHLLGSNQVLQLFLLASILMNAGQANAQLFLPRIVFSAGGAQRDLGLALFLQVGSEMPGMLITPWLLRRVRARALLTAAFASYLAKALIILFAGNITGVFIATASSLFCYGLYGISSVFFVNDIVRSHEKVRAQVLVAMSGALAAILANPLAGFVVDRFGVHTLNVFCAVFQFAALITMTLCAWLQNNTEAGAAAIRE